MKFLVLILSCLALASCGVKGDPVGPESPADFGTGKPLYKYPSESPTPTPKDKR